VRRQWGSLYRARRRSAYRPASARAYRVENSRIIGRSVSEVTAVLGVSDAFVMRVRQDGAFVDANNGTVLKNGATVAIVGDVQAVLAGGKALGPEVHDPELLSFPTEQLEIVVTKKNAANQTIKQLRDMELARFGRGVFLSKLTRGVPDLTI
jgi:putative transport protein